MKRGTAAKVILGKDTLMDVPAGIVHGTDVILGGKAGLLNDFGGLVLSNNLMLGKKVSRGTITTITVRGQSPLVLPDAIAGSLQAVKAFGGTEQRNIPQPYTQVNYVTNTAQTAVNTGVMIDFAKNYEFEVECRAVSGSWYILQSRASSSGNITGISGSTSGSTITLVVGNVTACTSAITRTVGNKLYVKATLNNGTATLYVKDETANTEDTQTGSYGTTQPNPTAAVYLLGNAGGQYADINSDIYMARIKENGVTVIDYVPARQVATAGFYDTVSGTFKTALTPANLSADGNTVPTPDAPMDIVSNNGVLKVSPNLFDKNASYALFNGYLTNASVGQNATLSGFAGGDKTIIIKVAPNTTYTVTRATNLGSVYDRIRCAAFTTLPSSGLTGVMLYNLSQNTQQANATFTTLSDTQYVAINVRNTGAVGDDWTQFVDAFQLEKGSTATPYMPYGQIYTDGTVETINVHGKNLCNLETPYVVTISTPNYTDSLTPTWCKFKENTRYTITYRFTPEEVTYSAAGNLIFTVVTYTDGTIDYNCGIKDNSLSSGIATYTTTAGKTIASIVGLYRHNRLTGGTITINSMQIEEGTTSTDYEPYYDGGTATAEMLLKVGDYQDEQEILSGAVTRNVGIKVLDGTEDWRKTTSGARWLFFINTQGTSVENSLPICNVATGYTNAWTDSPNRVIVRSNKNVGFMNMSCTTINSTITNWTTYLAEQYAAGTPVITVYPLATPTAESVAGQALQVTNGDNVLEITQASLTRLELEATYKSLVQLTIQEVEDANLNNNVEVTIS